MLHAPNVSSSKYSHELLSTLLCIVPHILHGFVSALHIAGIRTFSFLQGQSVIKVFLLSLTFSRRDLSSRLPLGVLSVGTNFHAYTNCGFPKVSCIFVGISPVFFSGSHLTAKFGFCCPVFFWHFMLLSKTEEPWYTIIYYNIVKARSPLDCINRIYHFSNCLRLIWIRLPFIITKLR